MSKQTVALSKNPLRLSGPAYGGDYNPEQWDAQTFERDLELMLESGVNMVSIGIFSWARLEPVEGAYDFDWIGQIIDRLHQVGIDVDLATGTASPPAWMANDYPESLPVNADGVRLGFGSRQQYCPSSVVYRERSRALAGALAKRFGDHPGVVLWHINNEYACHISECFCSTCRTEFQNWLGKRYGSVEQVNIAWGTDFWSQRYASLEQIDVPKAMPTFPNPSQRLDWRRFSNHQILGCMTGELEAIRKHSAIPITTNFMGGFPKLDYREWAQHLDIITDDHYPDPADPAGAWEIAWQSDVMRGLANGAPWLLMEQTTSAVQWRRRNSPKRPGQYALWSLQRMAHGSDGILQFQWRQSFRGSETFHGGMVPHAGKASPVWRDVVDLGQTLKNLAPVVGELNSSDIAIVIDWESEWALEVATGPAEHDSPFEGARAWHRTAWELGIATDVVGPNDPLDSYKLVIIPQVFIDRPELAAAAERVAANGGQVVVTAGSAVVDDNLGAILGGYLGSFKDLLGVQVVEHALLTGPDYLAAEADAERANQVNRLTRAVGTPAAETWLGLATEHEGLNVILGSIGEQGTDLRGGQWAEHVVATIQAGPTERADRDLPADIVAQGFAVAGLVGDAEIIATFDGRGGGVDLEGLPAITRRKVAAADASAKPGSAWYVATDLDCVSRAAFLRLVTAHARGFPVVAGLPDGVEAQRRGDILFLLNHSDKSVELNGIVGTELIFGQQCTGHVVIAPRSTMVVAP